MRKHLYTIVFVCLLVLAAWWSGFFPEQQVWAFGGGGGGGSTLPSASGTGQCLNSVSSGSTASVWGSCGTGNLPAIGSAGQALVVNSAGSAPTWATCAGDVTCSALTPGSYTVTGINGAAVPASATLLGSNSSHQLTSTSTTMGGDLSGSFPNPTVAQVNGAAVPATSALLASNSSHQVIAATIPVAVSNGGTGGTSAAAATAHNIGAAALGANSDITSLTGLTTPLSTAQGGSGLASPTAHSVPVAEGASNFSLVALASDQLLAGVTGADPAALALTNCGDATHALSYNTTAHLFGCQAITATASPGGTTGSVQYNNAGALGGATITGLVKGNGASVPTAAVAGTDFQAPIAGNTLAAHNFATSINASGAISGAQPAAGDITGLAPSATTDTTNAANISSGTLPAARLPNPAVSTLGGVKSATAPANNFQTGIDTTGAPTFAQPAFSNVSGNISTSQMNSGTGASGSTFWRGDGTWDAVTASAAGTTGNPQINVGGAITAVANTYHLGASGTDKIFNALQTCYGSGATVCDIIGDPGQTYTETGPDLVGTPTSGTGIQVTLQLDNASVVFNDTTTFPRDDGLVLSPNSKLFCSGYGNSVNNAFIGTSTTAQLNSVVTSLGGVILPPWVAATAMVRGQFVFDSTTNTVDYVSACSGTCTTGGAAPTFSATPGATVVDNSGANQVTWTTLVHNASRITDSGNLNINGCGIHGATGAGAQINNLLHVSGVAGGQFGISNVTLVGLSTAHGSIDATGSDAVLVDAGQGNGFCTGSGAPLAGCTGVGTGADQSGEVNTCCGMFSNVTMLAPGTPAGNGPGYVVRITTLQGTGVNGTVTQIHWKGGQMSDISGSNNIAFLEADGGAGPIVDEGTYFEQFNGGGHNTAPGAVYVSCNNCRHMDVRGALFGSSGVEGLAAVAQVASVNTDWFHIGGRLLGNSLATDLINNTADSYVSLTSGLPNSGTASFDYTYNPTAKAGPAVFDGGSAVQVGSLTNPFGPGGTGTYYSAAGTPIPACAAAYERYFSCVSDSTACTSGTTYTSGGSTACLLQCSNAGTAWKETGVACF